jgi:hypothetical protein
VDAVGLLGSRGSQRPEGLDRRATYLQGVAQLRTWRGIVVATTARWLWVNEREYTADVAIVDEAWQMTYADLGGLGPLSAQVVLVGDPGQIAPVVTGGSRRWRDWSAGPQRAAPDALLAAYPDSVTRLQLSHTWRLGPATTSLIQPAFYADLPFDSRRPPRHVELGGTWLPKLSIRHMQTLAGPGDPILAKTAAARVVDLLDGGFVVDDDRIQDTTRPTRRRSHNAARRTGKRRGRQAGRLSRCVHRHCEPGSRAGARRGCVCSSAGWVPRSPTFAIDPGRLCVALSRHRAHATVIVDPDTEVVLRQAQADDPHDARVAIQCYVINALGGSMST